MLFRSARQCGRPVKWAEDRREHMLTANHARDTGCELEIACTRDGRILAMRGVAHTDIGAYIRTNGAEGLREVTDNAVLNANYVRAQLTDDYALKYDRTCMHEVVFTGNRQKAKGVNTLAIAKRLIDFGFHPPTICFPLIVEEALMIEPTETEKIGRAHV